MFGQGREGKEWEGPVGPTGRRTWSFGRTAGRPVPGEEKVGEEWGGIGEDQLVGLTGQWTWSLRRKGGRPAPGSSQVSVKRRGQRCLERSTLGLKIAGASPETGQGMGQPRGGVATSWSDGEGGPVGRPVSRLGRWEEGDRPLGRGGKDWGRTSWSDGPAGRSPGREGKEWRGRTSWSTGQSWVGENRGGRPAHP